MSPTPKSEVRVTPYGIPYVVEFANVSIWPRPPMVHASVGYDASDLIPKPSLSRSNTLPATVTHKPLPSLPMPVRSKSLGLIRAKKSFTHAEPESVVEEVDLARPIIRRNASFAAGARNSAHRHFKVFNDIFTASEETLVEPEDSVTFTPPVCTAPSESGLSLRTGGLYIRFPTTSSSTFSETPSSSPPPPPLIEPEGEETLPTDFEKATRSRLYRLSRAISKAVLAAGMEAPPKPEKKFEIERERDESACTRKGHQGLFKGTYGQVRAAFRAAGLVTIPCGEDGVPNGNATRLGALFIANSDGRGAIVFTKVVLWG
ncbi:hypothetical protein B0F90DRAFT_1665107 [Multifurca ochricompacta]|uniref:Uncharacterized protein n=1 Tax=Multifurca ochricompacta TaxID=376703 RepID=A0AAD4QS98_9AGAM|nr:hypothetical protein B0F90DRAFT_1665107 [Multifurca ochricompacta]